MCDHNTTPRTENDLESEEALDSRLEPLSLSRLRNPAGLICNIGEETEW
jgi:hypothetical protein